MQKTVYDLIARRRDAAIKIILRTKELECDPYLPRDASLRLRKVVLDQLNEFHDLCADLMKTLDSDEFVLNEAFLEKLDEIHRVVVGKRG